HPSQLPQRGDPLCPRRRGLRASLLEAIDLGGPPWPSLSKIPGQPTLATISDPEGNRVLLVTAVGEPAPIQPRRRLIADTRDLGGEHRGTAFVPDGFCGILEATINQLVQDVVH